MESDVRESTLANVTMLLSELPVQWPVDQWRPARTDTLQILEELHECLTTNTCTAEQATIVIGQSLHYGNSLYGKVSGEDIWARSSIDAFQSLGYTVLFTYDVVETILVYQAFPDLVTALIMDAPDVAHCLTYGIPKVLSKDDMKFNPIVLDTKQAAVILKEQAAAGLQQDEMLIGGGNDKKIGWRGFRVNPDDQLKGCVKRKGFEDGIPLWKMFSLHFWANPWHPLGTAWTLSPEDFEKTNDKHSGNDYNTYLGYSIEKWCTQYANYPPKGKKNRAFIFGKQPKYFGEEMSSFYNDNHTFSDLKESLDMDFITAMGDGQILPDKGITNIGRVPLGDFYKELAQSIMLVGIGNPGLSPSPYDALCVGVPFLNPILYWNQEDPTDRSRWFSQHNRLNEVDPPYVYHVFRDDLDGLKEALRQAREAPIDRFIPEWMTTEANRRRHAEFLEVDWKERASQLLHSMSAEERAQKSLREVLL